jgi:peptidoglycan/LPS O-acetylase OafA/YrhL
MSKRLETLDSLRGLAALIVVFHHFIVFNGEIIKDYIPKDINDIFHFISDLNTEAVFFFFVLSGFSIGLAQKGKLIESRIKLNFYLYKRFKRILPIYWLALFVTFVTGLLTNYILQPSYSLFNLIGNLFFLQTPTNATNYWFSPYGNNGPLWSLSYEMFFYLFFPIVSYALKPRKQLHKLILWSLLFISSVISIVINKYFIFIPILSYLSLFIVWWSGFEISICFLSRKQENSFWAIILVFTALVLLFSKFMSSASLIAIFKGLFIAALFYFLLRLNNFWKSNLKNQLKVSFNFIFNRIGHGSYALYAIHYPLFIYFSYVSLSLFQQIIYTLVLILFCPILEQWTIKKEFSFLRLNYTKLKTLEHIE